MSKASEIMADAESIEIIGGGPGDETFTHTHLGTFNVTKIKRYLEARDPVRLNIMNDAMLRDREVDQYRVTELLHADFPPIILIDCEDGTHCMIDGLHRVVARRQRGFDWIEARIATLTEVQPLMVHIRVRRQDGTYWPEREVDRAFLESDVGRHNGPDGRPRPNSTQQDWTFGPRRES